MDVILANGIQIAARVLVVVKVSCYQSKLLFIANVLRVHWLDRD